MAITQVGSTMHSSTADPSTSLTIGRPTGVASGDVLIAAVTANNSTITAPSGWTEFEGQTAPTVAWQCRLYRKVAGSSEPANYTWTVGSGGPSAGFVQAWTGVDNATPIDGTADNLLESDQAEPWTGPSATMGSASGKLFYVRGVRRTSAGGTAGTLSEADANASMHLSKSSLSASGNTAYVICIASANSQYTSSGSKSGLAISYDQTEATNYAATFGLREAATPVSASLDATLPAVASDFAATREIPSGSVESGIAPVGASFTGTPTDPQATLDTALAPITSSFSGTATGGPLETTLAPITSSMAGAVIPSGSFACALAPVTSSWGAETRQFGEHVIIVEADHRAFRVIDDDPGLVPIKRSEVTPPVNSVAPAGQADAAVTVNDATVSITQAPTTSAPAGHAAVAVSCVDPIAAIGGDGLASERWPGLWTPGSIEDSLGEGGVVSPAVTAYGATVSTSANAPAGATSVVSTANIPAALVGAPAGGVSIPAVVGGVSAGQGASGDAVSPAVTVNAATVSIGGGSGSASAELSTAVATVNQPTVRIQSLAESVLVSCAN